MLTKTLMFAVQMTLAGIVLFMHPASERRRYNVTPSLIDWAHIQNDPWIGLSDRRDLSVYIVRIAHSFSQTHYVLSINSSSAALTRKRLFVRQIHRPPVDSPNKKASHSQLWCCRCCQLEWANEQTVTLPKIWDLMLHYCNAMSKDSSSGNVS